MRGDGITVTYTLEVDGFFPLNQLIHFIEKAKRGLGHPENIQCWLRHIPGDRNQLPTFEIRLTDKEMPQRGHDRTDNPTGEGA